MKSKGASEKRELVGMPLVSEQADQLARVRADRSLPYANMIDVPLPPGPLGWAHRILERARLGDRTLSGYVIDRAQAAIDEGARGRGRRRREPGDDDDVSA